MLLHTAHLLKLKLSTITLQQPIHYNINDISHGCSSGGGEKQERPHVRDVRARQGRPGGQNYSVGALHCGTPRGPVEAAARYLVGTGRWRHHSALPLSVE